MVHSVNAFRAARAGSAAAGSVPGWQAMSGRKPAEICHVPVSYWCARGHETRPVFAELTEAEIPAEWECRHCGRPAVRSKGEAPAGRRDEAFKTHLEYAKERRNPAQAQWVLDQALDRLRKRRGQ
jgi:rubredoxin